MFCSGCGASLDEDARFCSGCGSRATPSEHALDQVYEVRKAQPQVVQPAGVPSAAQTQMPQFSAAVPPPNYYAPPQVHVTQQVQVAQPLFVGAPKSVGLALVLTFFFGPLGLLYSSVLGGIIMLVASVALAAVTFGISLFLTWPICMIWGAIAASNYNGGLMMQSRDVNQINRY